MMDEVAMWPATWVELVDVEGWGAGGVWTEGLFGRSRRGCWGVLGWIDCHFHSSYYAAKNNEIKYG